MNLLYQGLSILTGVGFIHYGISCLVSPTMRQEFERFGAAQYRVLTGILEILGGLGVLLGLFVPLIGALAAAGIALLMIMVVVQRIMQRDSLLQMAQALIFTMIASWLTVFGVLNW